jgi:hypothetical protein
MRNYAEFQRLILGYLFGWGLIMTAAIGIQIGIGTEIDEKAKNSTPIPIPTPMTQSTS